MLILGGRAPVRGDLEAVVQHSCLIKAQVYNRTRHRAKTAVVWKHALRFRPSRAGAGRVIYLFLDFYGSAASQGFRIQDSVFRDEGPSTAEQPWICRLGGLQRPPSTLLPGGGFCAPSSTAKQRYGKRQSKRHGDKGVRGPLLVCLGNQRQFWFWHVGILRR